MRFVAIRVKTEDLPKALVDIQVTWEWGRSTVQSTTDMGDGYFMVIANMTASYPFIENRWRRKWEA